MPENWQLGGFGLYVHWPFCQSKCPYCDFNSHVVDSVDQALWAKAFESEITRYAELTPGRVLDSIFFGGGTPSLMDPSVVETVIDTASRFWTVSNQLEVTLEANPTSVEAARFDGYAKAGVNRVSIGVQALNDRDLKALGRLHSVTEALRDVEIARNTFDRVSFDLIYARQDQSLEDWQSELVSALSFDPDHLSLYQLTIEDGTAFGDRFAAGKLRGLPSEDTSADMFEFTQECCENFGLPAYEVSNHARIGSESRHNMIYWSGGDYVGVGPGAHGRITVEGKRIATEAVSSPQDWLTRAISNTGFQDVSTGLSQTEVDAEYTMMALRTVNGIDLSRVSDWNSKLQNVESLIENGFLQIDFDRLTLTKRGKPLLNAILRELLPS